MKIVAVILAGGMGARLWPISRETYPKYLLQLSDGLTLLEKTVSRACMIPGVVEVSIATNRETYFLIEQKCARSTADTPLTFVLEPVRRNTCAAVCGASLTARSRHGDDVFVLVLPADHLIDDLDEFAYAVERAIEAASVNRLVMFGVPATYPETGYGYIECLSDCSSVHPDVKSVNRFIEKPHIDQARQSIARGHLWNTGMLCFRPATLWKEMDRLVPQLAHAVRQACVSARNCSSEFAEVVELEQAAFRECSDISIDQAILETSTQVSVVSCKFNWRDIGCWLAMSALAKQDSADNRIDADVRSIDTTGCYFRGGTRLIGAIGVKDLIVIDSDDALLIAAKDRAQDVKELVTELRADGHHCVHSHPTASRPWGSYTVLADGDGFKVKRLVVKPKASVSLQSHHHRDEHWVVVKGMAEAILGERVTRLRAPASTFIRAGTRHRIANIGSDDLIVVEVQFGELLSEDDIVRFEDAYGRAEQ